MREAGTPSRTQCSGRLFDSERRTRWLVGSLIGRVDVVLDLVCLFVVIVVAVVVVVEER